MLVWKIVLSWQRLLFHTLCSCSDAGWCSLMSRKFSQGVGSQYYFSFNMKIVSLFIGCRYLTALIDNAESWVLYHKISSKARRSCRHGSSSTMSPLYAPFSKISNLWRWWLASLPTTIPKYLQHWWWNGVPARHVSRRWEFQGLYELLTSCKSMFPCPLLPLVPGFLRQQVLFWYLTVFL